MVMFYYLQNIVLVFR